MDDELEDTYTYEYTFTAIEIDLDYEFDAARYFDFSREETPAEALEAQCWFDSAASYPPSPFITELAADVHLLWKNLNSSSKTKDDDDVSMSNSDSNEDDDNEGVSVADVKSCCAVKHPIKYDEEKDGETSIDARTSGLALHNHMVKDSFRNKINSAVKPSFLPRGSTLMNPTASHLAKQHKPQQAGGLRHGVYATMVEMMRENRPFAIYKSRAEKNQNISGNHCMIEVQAAKRQKLEGGHLPKVGALKQQINFVHKEAKKDGASDLNMQGKLKITIPREPNLETTQRAHRMRSKTSKEIDNLTSALPRFKARPLNRKMLESPSLLFSKRSTCRSAQFQEFRLITSERAAQHASATSTSTTPCTNSDKVSHKSSTSSTANCEKKEPRRPNLVETSKQEGLDLSHNFRACPLNKKMFTSKVGFGVFLNTKRPTNVPMEFDYQFDKRSHHNPPIELFNKLSLASDPQPSTGSQLKPPQFIGLPRKGSKENRWSYFLEEQSIKVWPKKYCIGLEASNSSLAITAG